jgi:subtilisin
VKPILKRISVRAVLLLSAASAGGAPEAAAGPQPFVVHADSPALRAGLPVRHRFPGRFSADLTPAQVEALRRLGIRVAPVGRMQLAAPRCSPWPQCRDGSGSGGSVRVAVPGDPTPWGIELLYGTGSLTATSGGAGVRVAVLDTGVNRNHPDLSRRVVDCADFTGGPAGSTRVRSGSCEDKEGHGTHVAGTILADGGADGLGIFGVAPEAALLAYKVCSSTGCWTDDIAAAIDRAGRQGAHIVSMSLGASQPSPLISEAVARNPQLLFVAAAGNDGPALGSIDYPGADPAVIAAGAIDAGLGVPDWSSRGINDGDFVVEAREVELGAPGVGVESTWMDGGYRVLSGTSMATPHVSGLAAKLWQGSAADTRALLQGLARDLHEAGDDPATGLGLPGL